MRTNSFQPIALSPILEIVIWVRGVGRSCLGIGVLTAIVLVFSPLLNASQAEASRVCPLDHAADPQLQQQLENLVSQQGLQPAAQRGDLALSLLILTDPEHPRLAQINGNQMLYAASLPKIAILLGAAIAIDQGDIIPDPALMENIHNMIRKSCNPCANRVIERVGQDRILEILQAPEYRFYDPDSGGGLWLGKEYGSQKAWRRDPLYGLSHGATTFQTARFYCGLQLGTLVSAEQNQMMLDALSKPGISHKFVKTLGQHDDLELF